ncbi:helix-turn-helix transcriptional regulator [Pseudomonas lundensis]|uniref:helix-turn-helix domain-containing protein n=1 Tax=Serratia proteamaculans TaxID=28151 RepID=UPI00298270DA|nr:helix-turn-helix transcriptional regulator [Serratia proteamaculans]MDW5501979.1 helix-turn-helix transcriptional regulator [Serratia proteamaculans]MDW5507039.1 helix-turn-helix transcriptional regulator [Pseudomonas lundensis]
MAKPLANLIDKLDPAVVEAARQKADKEIFELRLAMLREELAVSQVELAKRLGISQPSVANLEKRGSEIKLSSLKRYIEAMGGTLSLDVLLPNGQHRRMTL